MQYKVTLPTKINMHYTYNTFNRIDVIDLTTSAPRAHSISILGTGTICNITKLP